MRMLMRGLISVAVAFSFAATVFADGVEVLSKEDLKEIQDKLKSADQMTMKFSQETYSALRKKTRPSNGYAKFSKPNKFRWVVEKPVEEHWIFNGTDLFNYKPANKQAVKFRPEGDKAKQLQEIVNLVMNFDSLLARYNLRKAELNGDKVLIELAPRTASDIARIDLTLIPKENYVSALSMYFHDNNNLKLNFEKPALDKVPSSDFELDKSVKVSDTI